MNEILLLVLIGVFLCFLGLRTVDLLRKLQDSLDTSAKDRQSAVEVQTIGMMAAILMAGKLANPGYHNEMKEWQREVSEAKKYEASDKQGWREFVREFESDMHKRDVFHWEGQKRLVEMARETYDCAKQPKT
jgi:hypothetical protein